MSDGPRSPREEAERLVAAALGAVSVAAEGASRFVTDADGRCVCPVCRTINALRDPSPDFAERLATGAGDLATGVAGVLRAFATRCHGTSTDRRQGKQGTGTSG